MVVYLNIAPVCFSIVFLCYRRKGKTTKKCLSFLDSKAARAKEKRNSNCVGGEIMCVCIFCPITFCSSWSYHKLVFRHITHTMVENAVCSLLSWDRKWLWLTTKTWINTAGFHYACEEALLLSVHLLSVYLWAAGSWVRRADTPCLKAGESTMTGLH